MEQEEFRTALIAAINSMAEELRTLNDNLDRQNRLTALLAVHIKMSSFESLETQTSNLLAIVDKLSPSAK